MRHSIFAVLIMLMGTVQATSISGYQSGNLEAMAWAEDLVANQPQPHDQDLSWLIDLKGDNSPCTNCNTGVSTRDRYPIMAFVSFSMPTSLWIELSRALQEVGGAMVLRGLPDDSFPLLAKKLTRLTKQGVEAPVILDPRLFDEYDIQAVPAIVVDDGVSFDKISGSVSLDYALEQFASEGETDPDALAQEDHDV